MGINPETQKMKDEVLRWFHRKNTTHEDMPFNAQVTTRLARLLETDGFLGKDEEGNYYAFDPVDLVKRRNDNISRSNT